MADDLSEIWDPYDFSRETHPQKLAEPDSSILTQQQYKYARDVAFQAEIDNLSYLNKHPEVRAIIRILLREILAKKPVDMSKFMQSFFGRPIEELQTLIDEHVADFPVVQSDLNLRRDRKSKHPCGGGSLVNIPGSRMPSISAASSAGIFIRKQNL